MWSVSHNERHVRLDQTSASEKHMLTVLWSRKGPLDIEWLGPGKKIKTTYFCDGVIAKLVQALDPERAVPRQRKFSFHSDNARPRNSARAAELIDAKQFIRLPHPPDSPDGAPSDFDLVGMMKEKFKKCITRTFDALKQEVDSTLKSIPKAELISVFQTCLRRLQQVIDSGGEYV
jgi:hypothetical protein